MDAQLPSGTRGQHFGLSIHLYSCIVCVCVCVCVCEQGKLWQDSAGKQSLLEPLLLAYEISIKISLK